MPSIGPRDIMLAVRNDEELNQCFHGSVAGGGVLPCIHARFRDRRRIYPAPEGTDFHGCTTCTHPHSHSLMFCLRKVCE